MEQLMSEESHPLSRKPRKLTTSEQNLVICLLAKSNTHIDIDMNNLKVLEMNDGGMGSLYFVSDKNNKTNRVFGKTIIEKLFFDIDKVEISITLNVDTNGDLFELDIWRVDFEPLKLLPSCEKQQL